VGVGGAHVAPVWPRGEGGLRRVEERGGRLWGQGGGERGDLHDRDDDDDR
jgi:hypothetical protein